MGIAVITALKVLLPDTMLPELFFHARVSLSCIQNFYFQCDMNFNIKYLGNANHSLMIS